jgi:hypothetical protein
MRWALRRCAGLLKQLVGYLDAHITQNKVEIQACFHLCFALFFKNPEDAKLLSFVYLPVGM